MYPVGAAWGQDMIGHWGAGYSCAACEKGRCIMSGMRSRELAYVERIGMDLHQRLERQSARFDRYAEATDKELGRLRQMGHDLDTKRAPSAGGPAQ